jgi:hypothetical protein
MGASEEQLASPSFINNSPLSCLSSLGGGRDPVGGRGPEPFGGDGREPSGGGGKNKSARREAQLVPTGMPTIC